MELSSLMDLQFLKKMKNCEGNKINPEWKARGLRKPIRVTSCRFQVVASTLSLPSWRFHVVALMLKGGLCCQTLTNSSASP